MKYYFDESGDAGLKIEKGSSDEFSIAIVATNDSIKEIEFLKQTTRIKTIKKWHSTRTEHRKIINDVLALQLISFSRKITFIPAQDKEDRLGVLLADLVAGSIRNR